jgi:signal transduction histidine kinase/ligand-binding sensor domain-containing protein
MLRGRFRHWLPAATIIPLCCICFSSSIATPYSQRLTQYGHSSWRLQDGLFSSPNSIAQTKDGYLWIGTDAGLVRFDGVRFVPWNSFSDGSIATWGIDRVLAARDGSLWIGGQRHVAHVKDRQISRYETVGRAVDMTEDEQGEIWFAQTRVADGSGPVCRVNQEKADCFGKPDIPLPLTAVIGNSRDGGFWIGGASGLCHWSPGHPAACYLEDALKPLNGLIGVNALLTTRDGALWVGIARPGNELGLGKLVHGIWEPINAEGLDTHSLSVTALMEDREGAVWVGTLNNGLYRIRAGRAEHFGLAEGLSGVYVSDIYEDRESIVWVTTSGGLDAFRHLPVSVFSAREGLPADTVDAVLPARDGSIWIGSSQLSRLVDDVPTAPPEAALFRDRAVTSLLEDTAGRLWIGLNRTLNVFEHGKLRPIKSVNGDDLGPVEFIAEDAIHNVWVISAGIAPRIHRIRDSTVVELVDAQEFGAKQLGAPTALAPDPVEGMWFGYRTGAIARFANGEFHSYPGDAVNKGSVRAILAQPNGTVLAATAQGLLVQRDVSRLLVDVQHGLPCDRLRSLLRDAEGAVWLSASCGLVRIDAAELGRWLAAPDSKVQYRLFDGTDGVQSGNGSFTPNARIDRQGRLWFATSKVAQMLDPAEVSSPHPPPVIKVEQVIADRKIMTPADAITLPMGTRDIEIQYTALSFRVPQKIQFKYQLLGHDETWIDAGTRRAAFYNDLPPGRYRFKVIACNSDGVWNYEGASLGFEIPPAFYQTPWFKISCVIAAVTLLYLLYLARLRQAAARIRVRLVAKNAERERIARELHDTLLQSTQGLVLRFQAATRQLPTGNSVRGALELVLQQANEVMAEGRDRVQDLRISDAFSRNLVQSLSSVGEELAREYHLEFSVVLEGQQQDLKPFLTEEVYAIGREALRNAFTHAQARLVELQVIYSEVDFRLRCRDDGRGIDAGLVMAGRPGHFGLKGMRERAQKIGAQFDIWSRPNAGTELELQIPASLAYAKPKSHFQWLSWWFRAKE